MIPKTEPIYLFYKIISYMFKVNIVHFLLIMWTAQLQYNHADSNYRFIRQ